MLRSSGLFPRSVVGATSRPGVQVGPGDPVLPLEGEAAPSLRPHLGQPREEANGPQPAGRLRQERYDDQGGEARPLPSALTKEQHPEERKEHSIIEAKKGTGMDIIPAQAEVGRKRGQGLLEGSKLQHGREGA